jgi:hypothetical protein
VAAASASSPGDGEAIFLAVDHHERPHALALFVDDRNGGIAKQIGLCRPLDFDAITLEGESGRRRALRARPVDPILTCQRVEAAIARTDEELDPPVGTGYADLRALLLRSVSLVAMTAGPSR